MTVEIRWLQQKLPKKTAAAVVSRRTRRRGVRVELRVGCLAGGLLSGHGGNLFTGLFWGQCHNRRAVR